MTFGQCAFRLFISTSILFTCAQVNASQVSDLYQAHCASCHGKELEGGSAAAFDDDEWVFGSALEQVEAVIREGITDAGMPGFEALFDKKQISALASYVRKASVKPGLSGFPKHSSSAPAITGKEHKFSVEKVVDLSGTPWSMAFLPDGSMLITERSGRLWRYKSGKLIDIRTPPAVWAHGQGGLLDVQVHPEFAQNAWIYLAHSEGSRADGGMTKIVRGKIVDDVWVEEQTIYSAPTEHHTGRRYHFGSRIVFKDGYLYFSVGDRGDRDQAQDLTKPNGKIHRLHDDGRVPTDNPFVASKNALDTIWSYGHRNPQGMVIDSKTGLIWATEHGPRGGDELNVIKKGLNYGWPVITYGINYNGTSITSETHRKGMEQPKHYWVPSIATSGIDMYYGEVFPAWSGKLLASGMVTETLHLISLDGEKVSDDKIILEDQGRVRDVAVSPGGEVFLLLNTRSDGALYRLVPSN